MTKLTTSNPFTNLVLDSEEKSLETAFENGDYEESADLSNTKKLLQKGASNYLELNVTPQLSVHTD